MNVIFDENKLVFDMPSETETAQSFKTLSEKCRSAARLEFGGQGKIRKRA